MEKRIVKFIVAFMLVMFLGVTPAKAETMTYNYTPSSFDIADLNKVLSAAGDDQEVVVNFAAGTYALDGTIRVRSNTTINAVGATFLRSGNALTSGYNMLVNTGGNHEQLEGTGYTLSHDIVINGGTFDGGDVSKSSVPANLVNFGHASNITIKNATFKNCYGSHLIELSGVKDSSVLNCTFKGEGFRYNAKKDQSEAIQLDVCGEGLNGNFKADGTPCDNVLIQGNVVTNYPRAIGNHNVVSGSYNTNVSIIGNTLTCTKDAEKQAIFLNCFKNATVKNNTITGYGYGIQSVGGQGHVITGNTITDANANAISVRETTSVSEVSSNVIKNPALNGISIILGATVSSVKGNTITAAGNNAFVIADTKTKVTTLADNTIASPGANGVSVNDSAQVSNITGNAFRSVKGNAIRVSGNVSLISGNRFNNSKQNGIVLCQSGITIHTIKENQFTATAGKAITVSEGTVENILGNTIKDTDENPIKISGKNSKATLIADNVIDTCKLHAIAITDSAVVGEVNTNTITSAKQHAIAVNSKAKVTRIEGNTISDITKCGIYTSSSGSKITTVTKNAISGTGSHSVSATSKAYIGTVKANEITASKGYGISAVSNANIKNIISNKFSKCKNHAVYFGKGKVKTKINKNEFVSNKKSAIYLGKGITATVTNNTISKYSEKHQQIFTVGKKETRVMLTLKAITSKTKKVTGTAPAKSKITITIGDKKYTTKATSKGKVSVKIQKPKKGTKITTKLVDKNKNTLTATMKVK